MIFFSLFYRKESVSQWQSQLKAMFMNSFWSQGLVIIYVTSLLCKKYTKLKLIRYRQLLNDNNTNIVKVFFKWWVSETFNDSCKAMLQVLPLFFNVFSLIVNIGHSGQLLNLHLLLLLLSEQNKCLVRDNSFIRILLLARFALNSLSYSPLMYEAFHFFF